jgi:hypothetical protein
VEVDGLVHDQQVSYDAERDRVLSARGLRILRVPNSEVVQDLKGVLSRIEAACQERVGPNPPAPFPSREGGVSPSCTEDGWEKVPPPRVGEGPGERNPPSPRRGGAGGEVEP